MKNSIVFKFLAVLLCAAALLAALASAAGIIALASMGLYGEDTVASLQTQQLSGRLGYLAQRVAERYLAQTLGNCPQGYLDNAYTYSYPFTEFYSDRWFYTIKDEAGNIVDSKAGNFLVSQVTVYEEAFRTDYPAVVEQRVNGQETGAYIPGEPPQAVLEDGTQVTVPAYGHTEWYGYDDADGNTHEYTIAWAESDQWYHVTLYLFPDAYALEYQWVWELAQLGYQYRMELILALGASLLLFAITAVYLCCAAGRKPKSDQVRPGGLNRLPLDLYATAVGFAIFFLVYGGYELIAWQLEYFDPQWLLLLLIAAMGYAACLLFTGFCFACAAQFKAGNGFWYTHTVIGWAVRLICKLCGMLWKLVKKTFSWLGRKAPPAAKKLWGFTAALCAALYRGIRKLVVTVFSWLGKALGWLWRSFRRFVDLLPLTWQWLLTAFALLLIMAITVAPRQSTGLVVLGVGVCMAIVMYGTHCFGTLLESTKRMSQGDLDTQVEDKLLLGSFRDYAAHLNALAGVAVEAAKKQMKSERMKAELVTNVSHDIKTPLTSIINYVDLLQKAETQEQTAEYLEVLDRQSQRLKKLIEDLMEMSKASTGNMAVELRSVDAAEAINQALGEFADKLEAAQLTPVFTAPQPPITIEADGRLTWRVLSNLLSNAVKYALPGTRLYIDLVKLDGKVLISLKNISREQLGVSADELMERFVRGDASRNTEGSGLGLNIARNLMELQKGQLQLLVDGDLFKATLIFPQST